MGGTIGWILAAWPFTFILVDWAKVQRRRQRAGLRRVGSATVLGSGLTGEALQAGDEVDVHRRGHRVAVLAAFSLTPAAHAAEAGASRRDASSPGSKRETAQHPFYSRPVARDVRRCHRAQLLLQLDGHVSRHCGCSRRRGHRRQLDHAGDEHRPDRGNPDDVRSWA